MVKIKVNNMPEYAKEYNYVVVRIVYGEAWFYGAYDDETRAQEVAKEVDGLVTEMKGE